MTNSDWRYIQRNLARLEQGKYIEQVRHEAFRQNISNLLSSSTPEELAKPYIYTYTDSEGLHRVKTSLTRQDVLMALETYAEEKGQYGMTKIAQGLKALTRPDKRKNEDVDIYDILRGAEFVASPTTD